MATDPRSVTTVMDPLGVWWGIAGGWAIDLWLDDTTRQHHDVEVVVRRRDQSMVRSALGREWRMTCLDPPGSRWRPWLETECLAAPTFQAKARRDAGEFDLFLEDLDDDVWRFRRDARVQRPSNEVIVRSRSGVPVVRPEVQLLYMAKSREPKNQRDFTRARSRMDIDSVAWLGAALRLAHPDHPWISAL